MATAIYNGTESKLDQLQELPKGTSSVWKGGGFVFVSDNPEKVTPEDLADSGKWLVREYVFGSGFVYSWHQNGCGYPINHALSIYNPNPFPIRVSSPNNGTTNSNGGPDSTGWLSYFSGSTSTSVVIDGNSYKTLFNQYIPAGNNFGYLGQVSITNSNDGSAARALFYDIAWRTNSSGATSFASIKSPTMRRGVGPTYYNTMYFQTMTPTTNGVGYRICGSQEYPGVFGTEDLPYITDPSGAVSGLLAGGYGQQYAINMTIKNATSVSRKFHIFIGRPGPYNTNVSLHTFVNFKGVSLSRDWLAAGVYKDVISTNTLAPGASEDVSFFMVVPGMSATPVILGARAV